MGQAPRPEHQGAAIAQREQILRNNHGSTAPEDGSATLVGRAWLPQVHGPAVVALRGGRVIDITSTQTPTMRDLCEAPDPVALAQNAKGRDIGSAQDLLANSDERARDPDKPWLLAPVDLQAVKAAGVTFVVSLLERVIEEQARGNPEKAVAIRAEIAALIGDDLSKLKPGSGEAMALKQVLIDKGMWSQYLEVGIGPDAEIFTKGQAMSAVGPGADIGIHAASSWNNPEPEIVVAVTSAGAIIGATLGNDVNLRDVEGRSALLLGKAKDNNASCALGPFIRLFDEGFGLDHVRTAELDLAVTGADGFELTGNSSMRRISRDPADLVAATIGDHHQYPDGLVLMLGTMFAPVKDRGVKGEGFTHHAHDLVSISAKKFGRLTNRVRTSQDCAPWTFGAAALMRNLAARQLL
ncbi:Fumarylacetoacetate hydrolase family protein [hydrothermal vent metagenome]|uniref:Fumarylacetoacetate hydrolase family protein n=1 Tax=hydrothermal vent metagenome TaxID=652676 RepID=A0A3B0T4S4_9ZZZZ